jgi:hypothetical protein
VWGNGHPVRIAPQAATARSDGIEEVSPHGGGPLSPHDAPDRVAVLLHRPGTLQVTRANLRY